MFIKKQLNVFKKIGIALVLCIGMLSNAQELYKCSFSEWKASRKSKNAKLTIDDDILTISGKESNIGIVTKFDNLKIEANTVISFECKIESSESVIYYTTFSFKTALLPFFIYNKGKKVFKGFAQETWHKIEIPATELKTTKKKTLEAGSIINSLYFWQVGKGEQKLQIKNFKITNESAFVAK